MKIRNWISLFMLLLATACSDSDEPKYEETETESVHVSAEQFYKIIPNSKWKHVWCKPTDYDWNELADSNILYGFLEFNLAFDENGNIVVDNETIDTNYNENTGYIYNKSGNPMYYVYSLSEERLVICLKDQVYLSSFDNDAGLNFRTVAYRIVYERM